MSLETNILRVTALALAIFLIASPAATAQKDEANPSELAITNASFIAPSPEKENLNQEWVEISNLGVEEQVMTGWILMDGQEHEYAFPEDFVLLPGEKVIVHTGKGEDSDTDLYWNRSVPVWNNDGDVAKLFDEEGVEVSSYP